MNKRNKQPGFTLLEILLSIAIIAIIAGIGIPIYQSFQVRNDIDIAAAAYVQNLHRAQALSQAVDGDTSWGVYAVSGSITLFKGTSYAARDITYDEIFNVSNSIVLSGISEIVFSKFTGLPQTTGTIILTSINNENRNITINAKGMVNY